MFRGCCSTNSRSGRALAWANVGLRLASNLYGARAMTSRSSPTTARRPLSAFGLVVGVPVGEYDDTKVINIGTNRWSFKPEIGVSRRRGHWTFEGDVGMVAVHRQQQLPQRRPPRAGVDRDVSGPPDLHDPAGLLDGGRRQFLARRPGHHQRHAGTEEQHNSRVGGDHRDSSRSAAAPRRGQRRRAHPARRRLHVDRRVVLLRVDGGALDRWDGACLATPPELPSPIQNDQPSENVTPRSLRARRWDSAARCRT